MTLERRALSGTLIGVVAFAANAAQAFLFVPILLGAWGAKGYGAWLALQALVALIATLDMGHQAYAGNELAKLTFGDRHEMRVTLASSIWTAAAIGVVELIIAVVLGYGVLLPHALAMPEGVTARERLYPALMISVAAWVVAGSIGGIVGRLLPPAGKFVRFSVWGIATRGLQTIVVAGAALAGYHILGTTVVAQVATLLCCAALFYDLRRQFPDLWPMYRPASAAVGARNFARSLVLTGTSALVQLQQNGLNLLVTGILGIAALPVFATARTVASTFLQAANIIGAPLAPEMVRFHVKREYDKLLATFTASWLLGGTAVQLGILAALPVLAPVYALWTRHALPFDMGLFALLALAVSLRMLGTPLLAYLGAINHLRAVSTANAVQSLAVLGVAAVATRPLGLHGVGLAVLMGEVFGSCAVPFAFAMIDLPGAWRARLLRDTLLAAVPALVTGGALFLYARRAPLTVVLPPAALLLAALAVVQWRCLSADVQTRLVGLLRRKASAAS